MKRINFVLGVLFAWLLLASATTEASKAQPDGFTQTFDFTATAGITTGLIKLGQTDRPVHEGPIYEIGWGDGAYDHAVIEKPCSSCNFWGRHTYSEPGIYKVTLSYREFGEAGGGAHHFQELTATVNPIAGSFIIVSVGDSVASGEGNPVLPTGRFLGVEVAP